LDASASTEQRIAIYTPVAASICRVARNDMERAFLARQTYAETKLSEAVLHEECHLLGKLACDAGRAIGPWQAHRYCADAWTAPTLAERYDAGARCALRLARACRTPEGWFAAQSGRAQCKAAWARKRLPLFWRMVAQFRAVKAEEQEHE
jgi:hypothetical protein